MYLKTLRIKGFKSFADNTELVFEPGVTVVVGPNGSGKSNVVDAIGWVLGAQAPSAVRSQKMDDVIFAGTAKRPALGRAEVELMIDNSDGTLPIEFTEVTIRRTLFRSGESEYHINGVGCRLLDVQELLSDSGVGRQQHVIVSQGQIDAVLNARPEDRRQIIEEAAGVLKFRKRKERAERRLGSTDANLLRVQDLLREVRRQLKPLERQADAARRYESVASEARAIRTYLAGQELRALKAALRESVQRQQQWRAEDRGIRSKLANLDAQIAVCEAQIGAAGTDELNERLTRYEALNERVQGLGSLLEERARSTSREMQYAIDESVASTLAAELRQFEGELDHVTSELDRFGVQERSVLHHTEEVEALRVAFDERWGAAEFVNHSRAAEVRGELAALRLAHERSRNEHDRTYAQRDSTLSRRDLLAQEAIVVTDSCAEIQQRANELEVAVERLQQVEREWQGRCEETLERYEAARETFNRLSARCEALELGLAEAAAAAGLELVSELEGVAGTLRDLVEIDPGWELAFEAACGEGLGAVVVSDTSRAKAVLDSLVDHQGSGAVLAGGGHAHVRAFLGGHIVARNEVGAEVLGALLADVEAVDGTWVDALEVVERRPGLTVVTRAGDRLGPRGYWVGSGGTGATTAALESARLEMTASEELCVARQQDLLDARAGLSDARQAVDRARQELAACQTSLANAEHQRVRVEADREEIESALGSLSQHVESASAQVEREERRIAELEATLPRLLHEEQQLSEQAEQMRTERETLEVRAAEVAAQRTDLDVRRAGLLDRATYLHERIAQHQARIERLAAQGRSATSVRELAELKAATLAHLIEALTPRRQALVQQLAAVREERQRYVEAHRAVLLHLEGLRTDRGAAERELEQRREQLGRAEVADAETTIRIETVTTLIRQELDCEPSEAEATSAPETPGGVAPAARLRELDRDLKAMGPINPLALEEHAALLERHDFLVNQLEDIKTTRRELSKIIRAVDDEIVSVFAAAYADVSLHFSTLFDMLFPGGRGSLSLTQPDSLLETGIEIEAKPSGKNVKKLSLLSGGERSLTALAFLFAVFRSRPSPFYVMDEVEAALDDMNLHRFLALVAEFRDTAQLLIVSHQKRTMEAADVLYGVSMEPGGSSRVVSERATSLS